MLLEIWKKFVVLSGTSGITASTRQPLGVIRDDADMRAFFFRLMHETMAAGRAAGVEFPPDFPTELERSVAGFPPMMKASMAKDLHAGNRLELDWLAGKVVALGRKYGIRTPGLRDPKAVSNGALTVEHSRTSNVSGEIERCDTGVLGWSGVSPPGAIWQKSPRAAIFRGLITPTRLVAS